MKSTKIFFTLLIFSIAVTFSTGCSSPIGGIQDSKDYIIAKPIRFLYEYYENFVPKEGVEVVGIFGGVEQDIKIEDVNVKIKIKNNPSGQEGSFTESDKDGFPLGSYIGINTVSISYRGMDTNYQIQVKDKNGGGGSSEPGGPSIIIDCEW